MFIKKIIDLLKKGELYLEVTAYKIPIETLQITVISLVISVISYLIFLHLNLVVAYNDARAHMNMARLVYDNLTPGFAQIGSVWLPLDHILKLLFVWNDTLWQSGFAGSIWSMMAFVATANVVFLLAKKITGDKNASFLGTLLFITNLNVLYLQSTPLTESLLLLFFTLTTFFLYSWSKNKKTEYLILTALSVFFATVTRYDGWFLFGITFLLIVFISFKDILKDKKESIRIVIQKHLVLLEGRIILFSTLGGFGIFLWFVWNLLIFGDPLYFATGPYSAKAQQDKIAAAGALFSRHDIFLSLLTYWYAMVDNIGLLLMFFSVIGLGLYIYKHKLSDRGLASYTLLSPLFFHVISLFLGISVLVVPELGVSITKQASASWFNVRYGLMILPAVAIFSAYFVKKNTLLKVILFLLIVMQFGLFYVNKDIITITDGVVGTSSLDVTDVRDWLVKNARNKDGLILTSISYNNALAFSTGMPLKRFIHEGTGKYWTESLADPTTHAQWIVMANGDVGDPVYTALFKKEGGNFLHFYDLKLRAKHTNIYERRKIQPGLVWRDVSDLRIDKKIFRFVGVNSYDLAYRSPEEIDETIKIAKENGINVIRFWAFGDGSKYGFQPEPGIYNQDMIDKISLIVKKAEKYNIKIIITLSNYWGDYGGVPQYLKWTELPNKNNEDLDKFYTDAKVKKIYKNYVKEIIDSTEPGTKIPIKSSNAILSWELMNEPRSSSGKNGQIVIDWAKEMSNYILTMDDNHIVSLGAEGFSDLYNQSKNGPSLSAISSIDSIGLSTAHYYIKSDKQNESKILEDWAKQSRDLNRKPLILEEVGFGKDPKQNNDKKREDLVKELFKNVEKDRINGVMFWNWALKIDDSYGISPLDPKDTELLKIIKNYSKNL